MVSCLFTDGVESDLSGVRGTPGFVSEENCCQLMSMKNLNDTVDLCLKANDEGWQLILGPDDKGDTGISGWGWFHNADCDDECNEYADRCGDSELHFVVETECGSIPSPSESVTPKMPCCERVKSLRLPMEPVPPPLVDYEYDYNYDYIGRRRGQGATQSQSASSDDKQDVYYCNPDSARRNMQVGVEYQLRDHFIDREWDAWIISDDSGIFEALGREFFVMGNLYLTASDTVDNVVKMYYTPGQGSVTISGHVMGRFLDNITGDALFPDDHPLGRQLYHFEVTYNDHESVPGWRSNFDVDQQQERIPYDTSGGQGFKAWEWDRDMDMAVPVACSNLSGGLFYPKEYPDRVTYFNATDLSVYSTTFKPEFSPFQFLIISSSGLGGVQSWSGVGAYIDKSCPQQPQDPEIDDIDGIYREMVCISTHGRERGGAGLLFDIEGDCCDTDPTPTQGGCIGGNCWNAETQSSTPNQHSLSHSETPKGNDEPEGLPPLPPICASLDGPDGPQPGSGRIFGTITEASFGPEVWNDEAITYVTDIVDDIADPFDGATDYKARFNAELIGSAEKYVKFVVPVLPGRERIFLRVQWYPNGSKNGPLPANFITKVGAGPEARVQCGDAGGAAIADCWVDFPAHGGDLFIGFDHQPKINMPLDIDLAGVHMMMFDSNCTSNMWLTFGVFAAPPDRDGDAFPAVGNDSYTQFVLFAGLGAFTVGAATIGFVRSRTARQRLAAHGKKLKQQAEDDDSDDDAAQSYFQDAKSTSHPVLESHGNASLTGGRLHGVKKGHPKGKQERKGVAPVREFPLKEMKPASE
jgi:hypothetical protein